MRVKMILAGLAVAATVFVSAPGQAMTLGSIWCTNGGHPPQGQPGTDSYENRTLVQKINYMVPHTYSNSNGLFTCYFLPDPGP